MIYKFFILLISILSFGISSPVFAADVEVSGLWVSNITDTSVTITVDIVNNKNLPSAYDITLAYKIEDDAGAFDETPDIVSGTIPPGESTLPLVVINSLQPGQDYYLEALNHTTIGGAEFSEALKSTSFTTLEEAGDTNNLDTGETTTNTTGGVECVETDGSYCLLEPIPEFGNKITPETGFGEYVNTLIRLILGVVGVIVVITFVYGGIMWMGTDSIFKKTDAKQRMEDAALGTLLLLGAYIILNTINPNLVDIKINIPSEFTSFEIEEETVPWDTYAGGGDASLCSEGFSNVPTYGSPTIINVCESMAGDLSDMLLAAKNSDIILTGSGSRSTAQQIELREKNCPDVYDSPAEDCTPPTARPGRSLHEAGLAIDFRCNGKSMMEAGGKDSVCFDWMSSNASGYGLKNLASEPWHWSTTGN